MSIMTRHSAWIPFLATSALLSSKGLVRALSTTSATPPKYNQIVKNVAVPGLKNGMDYVTLGDSDLVVSRVCMGTMTFGEQNTLEEGVEQLNLAFDQYGINFLDTAEMYPVPTNAETQGRTDESVAQFLKQQKREDVILATKVAGRSPISWLPRRIKGTESAVTKEQIIDSVEASLKRLGTDYIDLLQIHWPDRYTGGLFGGADFLPSQYEDKPTPTPFTEQLEGLQQVVKEGKVKYVGVSNETPFGVSSFCSLAQQFPDLYPKIVSIQNSYSLIVRKGYEGAGLAEVCYHNNVGLLAYSPLGAGVLSGKYRDINNLPKKSRLSMFPGFQDRYIQSLSAKAVEEYCVLAENNNLTPTQLALGWCYHNELVASSIIGATTMEQLTENLKSYDVRLTDDLQEEITKIYYKYPDPTKVPR